MSDHSSPGTKIASAITDFLGRPTTLLAAFVLVIVWIPSYLLIHDINTWQLVINTGTTIITFLVAFAIQSTQNRAERAINAKLDALLAVNPDASNRLLGLEDEDEDTIMAARAEVHRKADGE